jgi:CPA1 family monovalent cation:H+ antiporter
MQESVEAFFVPIELFVVLLAVATAVALLAKRVPLPYSVALVLAGLGIAFVFPGNKVEVTPELILAVLLPGLVFEAAYKTDLGELRRSFSVVAILAAPGVLITAGVVAVIVSAATGMDVGTAFVLGAMISATDPVAVVSLFKRVGAPRRLTTLVEAESLLNDGTGVVLFAIALQALERQVSPVEGIVSFFGAVLISGAVGFVTGFVARRLLDSVDDTVIAVAITVVAAYGTYLFVDRLHESGIIATVVVGLMIGNEGHPLRERTKEALDVVWEFAAFALTALTFLLVGFAITPDLLVQAIPVIVAGYIAITLARAAVVYGIIGGGERMLPGPSSIPIGYLNVMFWAGLRGAVAVALALALPADINDRELLTGTVFGIVLVTLLLQGTTAGFVMRRSGVTSAVAEDGAAVEPATP